MIHPSVRIWERNGPKFYMPRMEKVQEAIETLYDSHSCSWEIPGRPYSPPQYHTTIMVKTLTVESLCEKIMDSHADGLVGVRARLMWHPFGPIDWCPTPSNV